MGLWRLRLRSAEVARRSVLTLVGAALLIVALTFFTTALGAALASALGRIWSAVILGALYLLGGLICLAIAHSARSRAYRAAEEARQAEYEAPMERVLRAFLDGISAGSVAGGSFRGRRRR